MRLWVTCYRPPHVHLIISLAASSDNDVCAGLKSAWGVTFSLLKHQVMCGVFVCTCGPWTGARKTSLRQSSLIYIGHNDFIQPEKLKRDHLYCLSIDPQTTSWPPLITTTIISSNPNHRHYRTFTSDLHENQDLTACWTGPLISCWPGLWVSAGPHESSWVLQSEHEVLQVSN